jgi:hypothetical protein
MATDQRRRGVIVTVPDGNKVKRLGKFVLCRVSPDDLPEYIWTADVAPAWKDTKRAGWSLNFALWKASQDEAWLVNWFYLRDREEEAVYRINRDDIAKHKIPGGIGPWGQNITIRYDFWTKLLPPQGLPPRLPFIKGDVEEDFLRLVPIRVQEGDTGPSDEEKLMMQGEADALFYRWGKELWGDPEPIKKALIELYGRAYPHLDRTDRNIKGKKWIDVGGPLFPPPKPKKSRKKAEQ